MKKIKKKKNEFYSYFETNFFDSYRDLRHFLSEAQKVALLVFNKVFRKDMLG